MNEERLQFLVTLNDRLRPLRDPVEIQDVAARLLGEHLAVNRVIYAELYGDEFVITRSYQDGVGPFAGSGRVAALGEALLEAYRRGETVVVNDVSTDPRFTDDERSNLAANQIAAFVRVMFIKDGQLAASFGVHSATPRGWTRGQIALIETTGERTWSAAERARAENAIRETEERHAFLLKLTDALRGLSDPDDVQQTAASLLGEHLQVNRVGYAEMEAHGYVIRREYTRGVAPLVGHGTSGTFGAALRDAYRRGETVVVNDVSSDPRFTDSERVSSEARQLEVFIGRMSCK